MGSVRVAPVTVSRPFANTGLDFAEPFVSKMTKGRGISATKVYLAIFVCLRCKAVHIEVMGDLTTASFLAALKRFTSQRGATSEIWFDNATTFHGICSELRAGLRNAEIDWSLVSGSLTESVSRGDRL